jgi:hypothetical protein
VLTAIVAIGVVCAALAVRFVAFPSKDPIGKTSVVVVLGPWNENDRIATAERVQALSPGVPVLLSDDSGCPSAFRLRFPRLVCFHPSPDSTRGEARFAASYAAAHHDTTMTVIAPRAQLSRARIRFSRCWAGRLSMVEAPMSLLEAVWQLPYQIAATIKAETFQRQC